MGIAMSGTSVDQKQNYRTVFIMTKRLILGHCAHFSIRFVSGFHVQRCTIGLRHHRSNSGPQSATACQAMHAPTSSVLHDA